MLVRGLFPSTHSAVHSCVITRITSKTYKFATNKIRKYEDTRDHPLDMFYARSMAFYVAFRS